MPQARFAKLKLSTSCFVHGFYYFTVAVYLTVTVLIFFRFRAIKKDPANAHHFNRQPTPSTQRRPTSTHKPGSPVAQRRATKPEAMANSSTASGIAQTVDIALDENEPLGVRINDGLVITTVQQGTPASGHLRKGDTIVSVNGRKINGQRQFYAILRGAHPVARIEFKRPRNKDEIPIEVRDEATESLPEEIRAAIQPRPGYKYQLVRVQFVRGTKFGMAIKTRDNRVLVTDVQPNSMCAAAKLEVYDHIVYIDGDRVTQAEVAQSLLSSGMKNKGYVELVIGRPATNEAKHAARQALSQEDAHDPPSVRLNTDVQHIMRQQIINMANNRRQPAPAGILLPARTTPPPSRHVTFGGQNMIVRIQNDNVGRPLRAVTTGIPNSPIRQPTQN